MYGLRSLPSVDGCALKRGLQLHRQGHPFRGDLWTSQRRQA
jgi:hypothetical protein